MATAVKIRGCAHPKVATCFQGRAKALQRASCTELASRPPSQGPGPTLIVTDIRMQSMHIVAYFVLDRNC